ncbi:MAG: iron dependent repressor, metal binding and dimerization domain protein [Christensenellales bacterium]
MRKFLIDVLGIKYEIADTDACAIEYVISVETLCSLCCFTNKKCPGGCYMKTPDIFSDLLK